MEHRWILTFDRYDGLCAKAVNIISKEISSHIGYVLPVKEFAALTASEKKNCDVFHVGLSEELPREAENISAVPQKPEGYLIYAGKSRFCKYRRMLEIIGRDERGLLYGCVDFINKYAKDVAFADGAPIGEINVSAAPAVKTRAVWTWGHVIYDYRGFFENMLRLRLNEIVIWNDRLPINAPEVAEYARSLGIKVIWGFAWGWSTACRSTLESLDETRLEKLKNDIIRAYETEYADAPGDGIYFQSFTELGADTVNWKNIAQTVVGLVNGVCEELYKKEPSLHVQFGLHATSVKNHLDILKNTDDRIYIIWEDCGAFPYNYDAEKTDGFDETLEFTQKIASLRGKDERFGVVFKGMLNLDWTTFEHFTERYVLGEKTEKFIFDRQQEKNAKWETVTESWQKNAEYFVKTVRLILSQNENAVVEALIEDAMFENEIKLPAAVYAETLFTPEKSADEIIETVKKYDFIK